MNKSPFKQLLDWKMEWTRKERDKGLGLLVDLNKQVDKCEDAMTEAQTALYQAEVARDDMRKQITVLDGCKLALLSLSEQFEDDSESAE